MIASLVLAFVLSGAAGLVYESIWSRYLGLFLGHSAYAQILVLVLFLGGMSGGAVLAARRSDRLREPLFWYAVVEAVVGVIGLLFHPTYVAVTGFAYEQIFPRLGDPGAIVAAKWTIAGLLILPQSILLGATFPLMSAGVLRRATASPGRVLALLYFANSFGAAAGVLWSGFFLIAAAGLPGTVTAAATLNLLVAVAVLVASRTRRSASRGADPAPAPSSVVASSPRLANGIVRLLLVTTFGTAIASFVYEIAWIRMLSLVMGSATHSFELMLSAFILGLALGSLWIRSRADRLSDPLRALGWVQWTMGILAIATLPVYLASFQWVAQLLATFDRTEPGYHAFLVARYALALAVMLPATFCAGITLPLITRMLIAGGAGERAIGLVYGVNAVGSIVGAAGAGLVLLPWLGLKGLLVAGAALDIALGIVLLAARRPAARSVAVAAHGPGRRWSASPARTAAWATAAAVVAVVAIAGASRFDRTVLSSGVYRTGRLADPAAGGIDFYRDGRTATVAVHRDTLVRELTLLTNGKPDASVGLEWLEGRADHHALGGDESTQVLLALVTLAHAPGAKTAAVIGQGSGVSSHYLLGSPALERLVTVEIEPEMIRASRAFYPLNRRVFEDPRSRFAIDDAKSYFAANRSRFDLVLSEPSNPWVSGVSGLFTTEFYRALRGHLTPDGVFGQWLHLYEISDELVLRVLAALHENFAYYEVFLVANGDMLVVATNRAAGLVPDWSIVDRPSIADDLRHLPHLDPRSFEAMRVTNRQALAPLIVMGPRPNSDYFPALDLGAERARYLRQSAFGFVHLNSDRHSLARAVPGRRASPVGPIEAATPGIPAIEALSISARLRSHPPGASADPRVREALHRRRMLESVLTAGLEPGDWRLWVESFRDVERDVHGPASGIVDEAFYAAVARYLERTHAPAEARATVAFERAMGTWDFAAAAHRADVLLAAAGRGENWLPPDVLMDEAVTAKLLAGDARGARRAWRTLRPLVRRSPEDVRSRLLTAYLAAAERSVEGPLGAVPTPSPEPARR